MNSKMTANSQLLTTEPKKKRPKTNKLSKQEKEQNHRNGDHMQGYHQGRGAGSGGNAIGNKWHKW